MTERKKRERKEGKKYRKTEMNEILRKTQCENIVDEKA